MYLFYLGVIVTAVASFFVPISGDFAKLGNRDIDRCYLQFPFLWNV